MNFHPTDQIKKLVERNISVVGVRNFRVIGRKEFRKRNAIVVALIHGINEVFKIRFCWIFTSFSTAADKPHAIAFADDVKKFAFRVKNHFRRVKGFARGDDVVDGSNLTSEIDVIKVVFTESSVCLSHFLFFSDLGREDKEKQDSAGLTKQSLLLVEQGRTDG